eukprot:TRINITY_DN5662_c0_g1_i6.p4 TRINITY_DN5662_c0_g1~~TRINITY_DN5662_c0_g1_i6.p4  ORF type:complete len:111 (+),score=30.08 TRINITY_DN5662_c0_g1_i6:101-433(+)
MPSLVGSEMCIRDSFIIVDVEQAMKDGMKFHLSKNKVVLTSGFNKVIPPKYFKKVTDKSRTKILFENSQLIKGSTNTNSNNNQQLQQQQQQLQMQNQSQTNQKFEEAKKA